MASLEQYPPLKETLASGQPIYGGWVGAFSREAVEKYQDSPFDFVGIDAQHSYLAVEDAVQLLDVLKYTKFPAVVRVNSLNEAAIGKALDGGAQAVIVPMVDNAEQAARAVAAKHYPPRGNRSAGAFGRNVGSLSHEERDEFGEIFVMIETADGLENVAEIAATPGLGGLFIGPGDLSIALGMLPPMSAFQTDQLKDAFAKVAKACQDNGIVFGAFAIDLPSAHRWVEWGCTFVPVADNAQQAANALGAALKGGPSEAGEAKLY